MRRLPHAEREVHIRDTAYRFQPRRQRDFADIRIPFTTPVLVTADVFTGLQGEAFETLVAYSNGMEWTGLNGNGPTAHGITTSAGTNLLFLDNGNSQVSLQSAAEVVAGVSVVDLIVIHNSSSIAQQGTVFLTSPSP